jgi:hypothetical protein
MKLPAASGPGIKNHNKLDEWALDDVHPEKWAQK